ncbi:hypothetical protein BDZ97DRAFT_1904758 [Flammula alnicola]|nr:hypothetical protein BDZ97DRAFT_1904758 [Flammula alnicola]
MPRAPFNLASSQGCEAPKTRPSYPHDFKNGVFLAPMVRSGALPTRLFALKHGATLVWGPEIVDKAILHSTREVDPVTEPYLIYQIGSSDPDLAVQAAKTVMQDVASHKSDLLCSILSALRREMPPHITVTAKIRLLHSQEDTLKLVERIVNTGVNKDKATIERLREIVDFVRGMGRGIARIREVTGADSVMIARGAESNPSCFSTNPLKDVENTLLPAYLRLSQYLENHFSLTKFCANQFKGARVEITKTESHALRQAVTQAKDYDNLKDVMGSSTGEEELLEIIKSIEENPPREHRMIMEETVVDSMEETAVDPMEETTVDSMEETAIDSLEVDSPTPESEENVSTVTPEGTQNPEPPSSGAPFLPNDIGRVLEALPGRDTTTPTPSGRLAPASL